jgi:hypothetical protein
MKPVTIFVAFIFAGISFFSYADEFYTILMQIDPENSRQIVELLLEHDISESMQMVRSIGETEKPRINDILKILCERNDKRERNKTEILIRLLIESVFDKSLTREILDTRIGTNRESLLLLVERFESFDDRILKADIIRLILLMKAPSQEALIHREGFNLVKLLKDQHGYCSPECEVEIIAILETIAISDSEDFFELCIQIMKNTKNSVVYDQAKNLVKGYSNQ